MLITVTFILLIINAFATNTLLTTKKLLSDESVSEQYNRHSSNFNARAFLSEIKKWPLKQEMQAIKNAISQGYLSVLEEQEDFIIGIARWPSSLKSLVADHAINNGNKRLLKEILKSLRTGDQKVLENVYSQVFAVRGNAEKYLKLILKFTDGMQLDSFEAFFLNAVYEGDLELLKVFLKNFDRFNSPQVIEKYGKNAEKVLLQKGVDLAKRNGKNEVVEAIQFYLDFYWLSGKSTLEIGEIIGNMPINFKRRIFQLAYSRKESKILNYFLSLEENEIYIIDLILWNAKYSRSSEILKLGLKYPMELTRLIILNHSPNRIQFFTRFLKEIQKMSRLDTRIRQLPPQDIIISYIFIIICESGQVDLIKVFFENPDLMMGRNVARVSDRIFQEYVKDSSLVSFPSSRNEIDASTWMIYNGIIAASKFKMDAMLNFLISKVDVSANENYLLILATIAGDEDLVSILLLKDQVMDSVLDEAIQYALSEQNFKIYVLLHLSKNIMELAAPAA